MVAKRPRKKTPAKDGSIGESAPDAEQRKWEFLELLGQRGGPDYLFALRNAIESEASIPAEALKPLAIALRVFDSKEPRSVQLAAFAKALSLSGKRGRPRKDEEKFWRAVNYWLLRLEDEGPAGRRSDGEAIAWLEEHGSILPTDERCEFLEASQIRRAVHDHPDAKAFVESMKVGGE